MRHKAVRSALIILLAAVAVFAIGEAVLVLIGVRGLAAPYQGTFFPDARVPMLALAILVGGGSLLAAVMLFVRHPWGLFLAAAAGLIMIAREIIELALALDFSSTFVFVGLAVIALAEYLWAAEASGRQLPPLKHELIRVALVAMAAFIATSAIDGGAALLRGELDQYLSVDWLAGTPFSDYTIPGLVLVFVVGGGALLAATTVFIHRQWAVLLSALLGLLMVGYLVVEALILDSRVGSALPIVLGMQLLYFVPGLAIAWLAGFLWVREYRAQRPQLRRASQA